MGLPISKHKNCKTDPLTNPQFTAVHVEESFKNVPVIAKFAWTPSSTEDDHGQIHVKVGDRLISCGVSQDGYWTDVKSLVTGKRGWVPSNYIQHSDKYHDLEKEKYYHGTLERSYAEYLLNSGITGSYLLRDSEGSPGHYTISLRFEGEIIHYRIQYDELKEKFYLSDYAQFSSISELIKYHSNAKGSLKTLLLYPVNKFDPNSTNEYDFSSENVWEIPRTEIIMKHRLGSGQYGVVYEALWKTMNCNVAVKTIKEGITVGDEFLGEARLMKKLRHPNLVQLLGVCTREPPYYIITEFMANGNLLDFLQASFSSGQPLSPKRLLQMSIDVVHGMSYLEAHNFIHRDLAARNCLVGEQNFVVKIADFGLARCLSREEDTYKAKEGAQFPIKWTAPEGLMFNTFSTKSDVWAFGILLWELATHGNVPYPGVHLNDVLSILEKGVRLECPVGCPTSIYKLMQDCWQWCPDHRPSFKILSQQLENINSTKNLINEGLEFEELSLEQICISDLPNPCEQFINEDDGHFRTRFSSSEHIINCDPFDISPPILPLVLDNNDIVTNSNSHEDKIDELTNSLGRSNNNTKFAPLPPKRTTPLRQSQTNNSSNCESSSQEDIINDTSRTRPNLMTSSFVVQSSKKSEDQLSNFSAKSNFTTPSIHLPPTSIDNYRKKDSNRPISMVLPKNFRQELKLKLDQKSKEKVEKNLHFASKSLDDSENSLASSYTLPVRKRDSSKDRVINSNSNTSNDKSKDTFSSPSSVNSSLNSNNNFYLTNKNLKKKNISKRNSWSIPSYNSINGNDVSSKMNEASNNSSGFISKNSTNSSSPNFSFHSTSSGANNNQVNHYTSSRLPTLQSLSNNRLDKISDSNSTLPPNAVIHLLKRIILNINQIIKSDSISSNHDQLILLSDRIDEARIASLALIDSAECKAHAKFQFRDQCTKLSSFLPLTTKTLYNELLNILNCLVNNISKIFSVRNNHCSEIDANT